MAQKWLDLAEAAEHDDCSVSLRRRSIQIAIGEEIKNLYGLPEYLPPHLLALLVQINRQVGDRG
jgi:hypothetical protein